MARTTLVDDAPARFLAVTVYVFAAVDCDVRSAISRPLPASSRAPPGNGGSIDHETSGAPTCPTTGDREGWASARIPSVNTVPGAP
ncbi:hypothetical protein LMG10661_02985 [Ralstonia syzygii subsp. syzygii]|nr:hypothetical protein LMG10661_02985 [Ralstonia syzygii subsp. syzygii]